MSPIRRSLAVVAAVLVAASASAPAAGARPTPVRSVTSICAVKSSSKRPSPVRVCRQAAKAPRALPR